MKEIRLAIAGVGNCASSLLQGIEYYRDAGANPAGLLHPDIGGYSLPDIRVVAAFDVDSRKVGQSLGKAVFAPPNCTTVFRRDLPDYGVTVQMAPVFDGVARHMSHYAEKYAFRVASAEPVEVSRVLRETRAEVLVCYVPVGSEEAVRHYAESALQAGVAFINCVPVLIASDASWAEKFRSCGIPVIGDDVKSQVGATIVHRSLVRLLQDRGVRLERTYQLNTGGNTDFLNMLQNDRLATKRLSKTQAVQSQLDPPLPTENIHIGPSDYVPWQEDNKVCFIRLEWSGFGGVSNHMELRLSVEDSPNSAGVVVDAIRCAKLALDRRLGGPLLEVSAFLMKHPPEDVSDTVAREHFERWVDGK